MAASIALQGGLAPLCSPLSFEPFGDSSLFVALVVAVSITLVGEAPVLAVDLPIPIAVCLPHYSSVAVRARMEGRLEVDLTVDGEGRLAGIDILKGVNPLLDGATRRAFEQWVFQPRAGQLHVTVEFVLWRGDSEYCLPGPVFRIPDMITVYGYPEPVVITRT
jgi:TonB family protein